MGTFQIKGGKKLRGVIVPQGAKNEALQVICATLLTSEKITISNIPDIRDVNKLIELLSDLGVSIRKKSMGAFTFHATNINLDYLESETFKEKETPLRGSIMIMGPLLARFGKGYIPKPGGDKIGYRRLDTHFLGFQKLGAKLRFNSNESFYGVEGKKLKGTHILLDEASVTGTANIVMAAVLTEGTSTIYNAACEPYIQQLCKMLNSMGAAIKGIGSNLLIINGVRELSGCEHRVLPDMIEIGSWIGMAVMTASDITIKDVSYQNLGIIPSVFRKMGIKTELINGDNLHVPAQNHYKIENFIDGSILTISDAPWPGFTPDLLSIALVTATQACGSVLIHQKMFDRRLFFVDNLIDMGAQIILCDPHRATVVGLDKSVALKPTIMTSPDIRSGISLLIAALSAEGTSIIHNIGQIDRGYEKIDQRLKAIGAEIVRLN